MIPTISINIELTKLASFERCQKWRHSPSFLDGVTDDKWMFESGGTDLWLSVRLKVADMDALREAAVRAGMNTANARTLSPREIIEAVVNEELSLL